MTETKPNPDRYVLLTRMQAAKYLGVSKGTLAVWACKKSNIPYVKVGRMVQYRLSDLKQFIDMRTHVHEGYTVPILD